MKNKSLRSTVTLSMAVSAFVLSTACAFAIIDLGPSPGGSGAGTNNPGQKPRFISNAVLVKLTAQARVNLRGTGGGMEPPATRPPSPYVTCPVFRLPRVSSHMATRAPRDPAAALQP